MRSCVVPFPVPDPTFAEVIRSMIQELVPAGVPKVLAAAFWTWIVVAVGAEAAPTTAKTAVSTAKTASSTNGTRLRRGIRPT